MLSYGGGGVLLGRKKTPGVEPGVFGVRLSEVLSGDLNCEFEGTAVLVCTCAKPEGGVSVVLIPTGGMREVFGDSVVSVPPCAL